MMVVYVYLDDNIYSVNLILQSLVFEKNEDIRELKRFKESRMNGIKEKYFRYEVCRNINIEQLISSFIESLVDSFGN